MLDVNGSKTILVKVYFDLGSWIKGLTLETDIALILLKQFNHWQLDDTEFF